jgi:chromosome segregation ATPase
MFEVFKAKKKLGEVEDRCAQLERRIKQLELEWEDTYDRIKSLFHRIAKRAQRMEGGAAGDIEEAAATGTASVTGGLTEKQRAIQDQILKRRSRVSEVKQ